MNLFHFSWKVRKILIFLCVLYFIPDLLKAQDTIVEAKPDTALLQCTAVFDSEHLLNQPFKTLKDFSLTTPSAYYLKGKRMFYFGQEADGASLFIDGMQVDNSVDFPLQSIENYSFYGSGAPLYMGFALTGFTGIETKSPEEWAFNIDAYTDLANVMQTYTAEFAFGGPLVAKKKRKAGNRNAVFFMGGKFARSNNTDPVWKTNSELKPEVLINLQENPLRPTETGNGTYLNSEFVTAADFTGGGVPEQAGNSAWNSYAKIVIPVGKTLTVSAGNYTNVSSTESGNFENSVFNAANNAVVTKRNFDNYFKVNQMFHVNNDFDVAYTLQFQYANYYRRSESAGHKDRFFDYGYAGKLTTYKMPTYEIGSDTVDGVFYKDVWLLNSWDYDTLVTWQPGDLNPEMTAWTNDYYEIYAGQSHGHYQNLDQIMLGGGLLNGSSMGQVYGLWNSTGSQPGTYAENQTEKYIGRLMVELNYKAHYFLIGGEYHQDRQRSYTVKPIGLWNLMRGLTNFHIKELNTQNPVAINHNGVVDTIIYMRGYDSDAQREFDKNLRKKLGLPLDGLDYILIDSYDKKNNTINYYDQYGHLQTVKVDDNLFDLNMFSADELLNNGSSYVNYAGFDYTGSRQKRNTDPYAFFKDNSRLIDPMRPVYYAAYVNDEFTWKNLHVSAGLRLDVYNANRPVLRDKYSLFPVYTVASARQLLPFEPDIPENIGDDYYVYVDRMNNPTEISGFRHGDTWYLADGRETNDPNALNMGYGLSPYLADPEQEQIIDPEKTFKEYKSVLNLLPNLNISYTLRNRYCFYLNYNSHTQNPLGINDFRPDDYYFLRWKRIDVISNPALKPLRSGLLMAGFKSVLYRHITYDLAFVMSTLSNYYYVDKIAGAYPYEYNTILNDKKGIVTKGFVLSANYTDPKAYGLFGGINFTKLFPDETNKNYNDVSDMVLNTTVGYHFGTGTAYKGPVWGNAKVFSDFSAGLFYQFRKGTPYETENVNGGKAVRHTPDFHVVNLNVSKGFHFNENIWLDVYVLVENLLNIKNAFYVYPKTGLPDDDGFLDDPQWQEFINNQLSPESFRLLYQMKLNNPQNFDIPSIVRVGVRLNM